MSQIYDFIISQWYYVAAIMAVLYLLLQDDDEEVSTENDLSPQELALKLNDGNITVFDLRSKEQFNQSHIDAAKSIQLANNMPAVNKVIKHNMDIVLVCKDGMVSAKVLKRIKSSRRSGTFILKGGMQAWQSESFPVKVKPEFVKAK